MTGRIFNIQRYSISDGPGIRTTVFFKGCPLRCLWCHNPESWISETVIMVNESRCIHCKKCIEVCPTATNYCSACGKCVSICPGGARSLTGADITSEELLDRILRDRVFYEESDGGVTFSGGEPFAQPGFLHTMVELCAREKIHIALDTSGYVDEDVFRAVVPQINLLLFDLKIADPSKHKSFAGVGNEIIVKNLKYAASAKIPMEIRIPVIPEVNDSHEDIIALLDIIEDTGALSAIRFLPYHTTGVQKHIRLFGSYEFALLSRITEEKLQLFQRSAETRGFKTFIGG